MTNEQIKIKLTCLVKKERRLSKEVLELILLASQKQAYLEFGFDNILEWLTQGLGYSQDAAQRRIDGAKSLAQDASADLKRAQELLSHRLLNASEAEVVAYALKFLLEKTDPLRRPASESKSGLKRAIHQSSRGQCTYRDPHTGDRCKSRYHLQADHRSPRVPGEENRENLRLFCRQHNQFEGEKFLGRRVMAPYWKKH